MHHTISNRMFVLCIGMLVMATANAQNCKPMYTFDTVIPGVLTVSITVYPPFDNIDGNGQFVGVDADILRKFGEKACLKVSAASASPAASIQYVTSGRADISSSGWYRTEERAKVSERTCVCSAQARRPASRNQAISVSRARLRNDQIDRINPPSTRRFCPVM